MTHKTQGIESSFSEWLEDLNFVFQISQRIKPFWKKKKMTRRIDLLKNINQIIETFWWLKELNPSFQHDSKNWTLFKKHVSSKLIFFAKNIQRIEPSFEYDSKNWTFSNMTPKIELVRKMILRNETFFQHYLKDGTFESMTQRIGHFLIWLKELNLLFYMTPRTEPFYSRNLTFFFKIESKNWCFQKFHFKLLTLFWIWLTELNLFLKTWLTELNPFLKILTHRDWTLLFSMGQRTVVIHFLK